MPETNTSTMSSSEGQSPVVQWPDAPRESKFMRKAKEAPFVPLGILGLLGAVSYGAYMYKRRGQMSTSVYLMQFRVISQSMVVGAITIGVGMTIIPDLWKRFNGSDSGKSS